MARIPGPRYSTLIQASTETPVFGHKRSRLTVWLALVGLTIALAFGIYSGVNQNIESRNAVIATTISFVLCPGSLLFVTFIDAEPWTNGFVLMWLVIAIINAFVYGLVGYLVGRFLWKSS
jgi:drug/metabolite transporter (DMT)-like permease